MKFACPPRCHADVNQIQIAGFTLQPLIDQKIALMFNNERNPIFSALVFITDYALYQTYTFLTK